MISREDLEKLAQLKSDDGDPRSVACGSRFGGAFEILIKRKAFRSARYA